MGEGGEWRREGRGMQIMSNEPYQFKYINHLLVLYTTVIISDV